MKELAQYDGSDPSKPILLAIRGVVFDVSTGEPARLIEEDP